MLRFRAPAWAWLLTLAGMAGFAALGVWQLQRGAAKQRWLAQFESPVAPAALSAATPTPGPLELRRAAAAGRWQAGRQLLQDGQSRAGRPGYHVWTPLELTDGGLVLVNRGWIPQPFDAARQALTLPPGEVSVAGWWRALPEPGIRTAGSECRQVASFPVVVVYPTHAQLRCLLGEAVLPGLLLLDPLVPGGFVREWTAPGMPPERHYGYAVTWFGLGVTALVLFVMINLKRSDASEN